MNDNQGIRKVVIHCEQLDTEILKVKEELFSKHNPNQLVVLANNLSKESFLYKKSQSFRSIVDSKLDEKYFLYFCQGYECGLPSTKVVW